MNRDDEFLDRLRDEAVQLQYVPGDPAVFTRLAARVASRVAEERDPLEFIAAWFRPIASVLLVSLLVSTMALVFSDTYSLDQISTFTERAVASEDYYDGLY